MPHETFDLSKARCKGCIIALGVVIGAGMFNGWVWVLDTFTLMLHEAGHPILGIVSDRAMVYGGTVFQLLFPWLTLRHFSKLQQTDGIAVAWYWIAASLHNVGIYMADARAKELPLLGGLDPEYSHDWSEIFGRWHLTRFDTFIGNTVMLIAWLILIRTIWHYYNTPAEEKS